MLDPQRLLETNLFCSCLWHSCLGYRWLTLCVLHFGTATPFDRSNAIWIALVAFYKTFIPFDKFFNEYT